MQQERIEERLEFDSSKEDQESKFDTSEQLFEIKEISVIQMLTCSYSPSCDCAAY